MQTIQKKAVSKCAKNAALNKARAPATSPAKNSTAVELYKTKADKRRAKKERATQRKTKRERTKQKKAAAKEKAERKKAREAPKNSEWTKKSDSKSSMSYKTLFT